MAHAAAGPGYPIVYFDAMQVRVREDRSVRSLACYLALGVTCDGEREVLGIWWQETEGAKFWLAVLNDLRRRGVQDVLISCVDGLKGFPEAIEAVYPKTWVQTCIVHQIRSSMRYVAYRDKKRVAADLKPVYRAINADAAEGALGRLRRALGRSLPDDRRLLAAELELPHAVPRLAGRSAPRGVHDQQHREPQPPDPQSDQDPRALPRRASRDQAHLPRHPPSRDRLAAPLPLAQRAPRA